MSVVDQLTPGRARRLVEEVLALEEALSADAEELSDLLFSAIGELSEPTLKPRLVALRRCIHRGRFPAKGEWSDEISEVLPSTVSLRVLQWLDRRRLHESTVSALASAMEADGADEGRILQRVAALPAFRHALSQASPALLDELLRAERDRLPVLRRRTSIGLTKFVSRAATKTSPYSTFTATAAGQWHEGHSPTALASDGRGDLGCVLELDRLVVEQVLRALLERDPAGMGLRVRRNPSLQESEGRYTFLGRRPAESLVTIPATPQVAACLRIVGDGCASAELRETLAERAGRRPEDVAAFCGHLVRLGVLEYESPVADHSRTPLGDLIAHLGRVRPDTPLLSRLELLRTEFERGTSPDDITDYRAQQSRIAGLLAEIGAGLGLDWPDSSTLGKIAFHENAVVPHGRLTASKAAWRPVLDDLDVLRRWLGLHDRMLPVRLALARYAEHRFGAAATVSFLALHAAVQADLALPDDECPDWLRPLRPYLQLSTPVPADALERSPVPELALLHRLRRKSVATVLSGERHGTVIRTDPKLLVELTEDRPAWVRTPGSVGCYLQLLDESEEGGPLRAVVNTVSGGFGKGRGRWSRLLSQAGGDLPGARPDDGGPGQGTLLAELSGTFGVSVNLRDPVAPYEIDYPYTTSTRPAAERIPLGDLVVRTDPSSGLLELVSGSRDLPVRPAHLGMMADPLLPPAARLMLAAFGQSYLLHPSLSLLKPASAAESPEVELLPRVEVGRLVVQRAEWSAPAGLVPVQRPGEPDAEHLLRLARWLRSHGIPRRCFVRLRSSDGDWVSSVFAKSRKPMFLDLASMSMLAVFRHMTKGFTGRVTFEEALPDPDAATAVWGEAARVTECVVELSSEDGR
ncbi:hypothetical protein EAO73_16405 [Streptomyces sp. col6]|nr:hypothetical protein EAO73_16405 [Streptomyces sp. col6]